MLRIPPATHSGPTLGTDVLVVPGVGVKDGVELSTSEVPQLSPMSHSKLVRKEVLPHLMGRAPQMGVSVSVPKVGSPVTPGHILSYALPLCSCCLESQGGCRDRASAFTSPSRNAQTQLSSPFPIFLSLPLTTAPTGTPSEAPAWPYQPGPLTGAPIPHLSLCPAPASTYSGEVTTPSGPLSQESWQHPASTPGPCPTVDMLVGVLLSFYLPSLAASYTSSLS